MTLCIAAIGENGKAVVGIADRMITVGNLIEYEPKEKKIFQVTDSIFILIADDLSLPCEIIAEIRKRVENNREKEWQVAEIADLYHTVSATIPANRHLNRILPLFGLDRESFLEKSRDLSDALVDAITTQILEQEPSSVQALIVGVDSTGAHIYRQDKHNLKCENQAGYATIGSGQWLAEAEMTRIHYAKFVGIAQAAFMCYMAKKYAEPSSGVGAVYTDIAFAATKYFAFFPDELWLYLDNLHFEMKEQEAGAQIAHLTKWYEYFKSHEGKIKDTEQNRENEQR